MENENGDSQKIGQNGNGMPSTDQHGSQDGSVWPTITPIESRIIMFAKIIVEAILMLANSQQSACAEIATALMRHSGKKYHAIIDDAIEAMQTIKRMG